jgi:hypothetical protein
LAVANAASIANVAWGFAVDSEEIGDPEKTGDSEKVGVSEGAGDWDDAVPAIGMTLESACRSAVW